MKIYILAVMALFVFVAAQRDDTLRECYGKVADIFFILDSSSSIYVEDYRQVLNFVIEVVDRFDIGSNKTRIGALTFSDDYQVAFDLTRFRTKNEVMSAIDELTLPYKSGITNTDQSIRFVRDNANFRQDITKVIVVITDGGSRLPGMTKRESDIARDAGYHMVVVGVGQYLDEQEWRSIASDPDNEYLFNITELVTFHLLSNTLSRRICLMPPIILSRGCNVNQPTDLFFLAAQNGVKDALDLITAMSEDFRGQAYLEVRYVMDVCQERVDQYFQPMDFCSSFSETPYQINQTYVHLLTKLRSMTENQRNVISRSANQVAIMFIDDQSMRDDRFAILQTVRTIAQREGIHIVVVDLGARSYANLVNGLTSKREDIVNFHSQTFMQSVRQLVERTCVAANTPMSFTDGA